jgi:peroxiredoxin
VKRNWLRTVVLYVVSVVVVAVLGLWMGSILGRHKAEAVNAERRAELQAVLEKSLREIQVGKPFPDFTVWSSNGGHAFRIGELAPKGGLIIYLSVGCPTCVDAVAALHEARNAAGPKAMPVILVTSGDPVGLVGVMADRRISMPVYQDSEDTFRRRYGVKTYPTCFLLDDHGVVTRVATGIESTTDFAQVITQ